MEADRFGEKLMALRRARGWTIQQLADRLGYRSRGYLSEVESGKKRPSLDLVVKASRAMGVSADVLVRDELELPVREAEEG